MYTYTYIHIVWANLCTKFFDSKYTIPLHTCLRRKEKEMIIKERKGEYTVD